jgi:hypothetical protein
MVMSLSRLRGVFGVDIRKVTQGVFGAQAMHDGMAADTVTYGNPTLPLTTFLGLIQNTTTAQQAVKTRVIGAREKRDYAYGLLLSGMEVERTFIQSIADTNQSRAATILTGGGLVVADAPVHVKALLTLRNAKESGSITCDANVGLLVGAGARHPKASRYFGWQFTVDGGKTLTTLAPTPTHKTVISGLTPLTTVGVRVNLTNSEGAGPWSDIVTIVVR